MFFEVKNQNYVILHRYAEIHFFSWLSYAKITRRIANCSDLPKAKGLQECSVSENADCNVGYVYSKTNGKSECVPRECVNNEICKGESGKSGANLCDKYTGKCKCGGLATPCSGKNQFCKGSDENAACVECIDKDDCPVSDGVKTVICENNACSIKECKYGYHFSDNQCVIDDESSCYKDEKCSEEFPFCSHEKQGCVKCKQSSHCESDQFRIPNAIMTCNADFTCDYACLTSYAYDSSLKACRLIDDAFCEIVNGKRVPCNDFLESYNAKTMKCNTETQKCELAECKDGDAYDPALNACRTIDDSFCEIVNDKRVACSDFLESYNAKTMKCNAKTEKCEPAECKDEYAYSVEENKCTKNSVKQSCRENKDCGSDKICNCIINGQIVKGDSKCKGGGFYCTCEDEHTGSITYCKKDYTCKKTDYSTYLCSKQ